MSIHFANPWFLLLLPIGVVYLAWGQRRTYVNLAPARRQRLLVVRSLLVIAMVLAVAQPTWLARSRRAPLVFLCDVSDSIPEATLERERAFVADAWANRGSRHVEVVTFAGHARRAPLVGDRPEIHRHDGGDTDFAEALTFGRGLIPERAPRIVLLTDGNDPRGRVLAAVKRIADGGSEIDVVDLGGEVPTDARITGLRFPEVMRRQQPTRLTLEVSSTVPGTATLRLEEADFLVHEAPVVLKAGAQTVDVELEPTTAGLVRYRAQITLPGDSIPGNDRFDQIIPVAGPPHLLLVAATPEEGVELEHALDTQEITVEAVSPGSLPSTLEGLLSYDVILLAGVAPHLLDRLRQSALAAYVRDTGGGLVFVSGRAGLARDPDGKASALEEILPVEMAAPSERQEPPVALVLLIDRSGSMVGEKLGFAKQAALDAIDHLTAHDLVGVIAFDARFQWIVPLRILDDKDEVKAAVGSLGAGGGTRFYPALEESYFALAAADAAVRHAILLTDGVSTDPTADFAPLFERMRKASITVSTVAIGKGADAYLPELAKLGGGRSYRATRASEVPSLFVKETQNIQRDAAQRGDTLVKPAQPARELLGIDFATAPPLSGYVRTKAKATTEVLLETERHDPLLVRWRPGLGQVIAFTSDATTAWAERWLTSGWPGFGKLWAQLVRGAQRPIDRHDLLLALRRDGDRLELTVDAVDSDGRFLEDLEVHVRVIDGAGQSHEPTLAQVGPGRYRGELAIADGSVLGHPFALRTGRRFDGGWAVLPQPYPRELAAIGPNREMLAAITTVGRGTALDSAQAALRPTSEALSRNVPLGMPLTLIALALFLFDLILKRARWEARR